MKRRLPGEPIDNRVDSGNTAKSDGIHLMQGSAEYNERVMDLKNMTEVEKKNLKLANAHLKGKTKEIDPKQGDDWHKSEAKEAESWIKDKQASLQITDARRLNMAERASQLRVRKLDEQERLEKQARDQAEKSASKVDDKLVERRLPKALDSIVYNDTEQELFGPGSKVLNKYLDD